VKYADDLVLLAKEEKMLQKMTDIGGCYGMEMNVEKTKVMRISRQPFPVKIMVSRSLNFWNRLLLRRNTDSLTFLPLTCFLKAVVRLLAGMDGERVGGVVCLMFHVGFLAQSYSFLIWFLYTLFGFGLASPGRSAAPHRLSGAAQASRYDSKSKFLFVVLFVNSSFDGVSVHTRRLGSRLLFSH
jgi:hypothetical protein